MLTLFQIANSMYFMWIAIFGTGMLALSMIFGGGDHEIDHDADHDHDADAGDGGNMSFLSLKVLWMFMVGFGAGGFFAARAGSNVLLSSIGGIFFGLLLAVLGYALMNYLYRHQGNSVVNTQSIVGTVGVVETPILPGKIGEVRCHVVDHSEYFQATARNNEAYPMSTRVRVLEANGSTIVVGPVVDCQ